MDVILAVTADYANVTAEGKVNIIGVFGEVNPPEIPFSLPQFFLVITLDAGPAEFETDKDVQIVMMNSDGVRTVELGSTVRVPTPPRAGSRSLINQIIGLAGVRFEKSGDYQIAILVGGETKRTISLHVNGPSQGE